MSSTNRGYDRHKRDYYVTPKNHIERFLSVATKEYPDLLEGNILDPCAGGDSSHDMAYPSVIQSYSPRNIYTLDIREDSKAEYIGDYLNFKVRNYPWEVDTIITNPPFRLAREIINKALKDVKDGGYVVMLLRLNFFGSNKRFPFWQKQLPLHCYVHHDRMSFTEDGGTDSIEYCHMIWNKEAYPEYTKLEVI